jgi:hypothetical protein
VQIGGAGGDGTAARHAHHRDGNGDGERFPSDVHAPRRLLSGKVPRPSPLLRLSRVLGSWDWGLGHSKIGFGGGEIRPPSVRWRLVVVARSFLYVLSILFSTSVSSHIHAAGEGEGR